MAEGKNGDEDLNYQMKRTLICLLLGLSSVTLFGEDEQRFIFPPFAKEDMSRPTRTLCVESAYDDLRSIPIEELRGIMASASHSEQFDTAGELLRRGDQKTTFFRTHSVTR